MTSRQRYLLFVVGAFFVCAAKCASLVPPEKLVSISIPHLPTTRSERVVGFDLRVAGGRIAQLPNIPIGWNVSVENNASWNTKLEGSSAAGAAALDTSYFQKFLIVEKNESLEKFEIHGEVVLTEDFKTEHRLHVGFKDFVVRSVSAEHAP